MFGRGIWPVRWIPLLFLSVMLTACGSRLDDARNLTNAKGWTGRIISAGIFDLQTWRPRTFTPGQPLVVYIEGDGLAFLSATRVSDDPTPKDPLALKLALRDPRPNVVYIARPCQFVTGQNRRNCSYAYWTFARYNETVIASADSAISTLKAEAKASGVMLYGYSGGGAVAALLAARRPDVTRLTTIAGVLDHTRWTTMDKMTPLDASLNPTDVVAALEKIPQIHYSGADDTVVPTAVARSYLARFRTPPPLVVLPGVDHDCCWVNYWSGLLAKE